MPDKVGEFWGREPDSFVICESGGAKVYRREYVKWLLETMAANENIIDSIATGEAQITSYWDARAPYSRRDVIEFKMRTAVVRVLT